MSEFDEARKALGLDKGAGPEAARRAYEKLSGPGLTKKMAKRIEQAYAMLKEPSAWAGQGAEPSDAAEGKAFSSVAQSPDILSALERLAAQHGDAIDVSTITGALDQNTEDGAARLVRQLLQSNRVEAGSGLLRVLVNLLGQYTTCEWLKPRTAIRLLLMSFGFDAPGNALESNRMTLRGLEQWKDAVGPARFGYEGAAARGHEWARELAEFSNELPPAVRMFAGRAAARGDLALLSADLQPWVKKHRSEANKVRGLVRGDGEISKAILSLVPEEVVQRVEEISLPPGVANWAKIAVVMLAVVTALYVVFGSEEELDASAAQVVNARETICAALGEKSPACAFAGTVELGLLERDCIVVERILPELRLELDGFKMRRGGVIVGDQASAVVAASKILDAVFMSRCGAPPEGP